MTDNVQTGDVFNATRAIDARSHHGLMVQVAVLCAAVAFLDGVDTAAINVAAPRMADHLGLSRAHLGPIFSSGLLGAMVGALSFGWLADRVGRKRMLLIATAIFGVFSIATAFMNSFGPVLVMRLFTGLGLGGATPCFVALGSEYAPSARRARVTSLIWTAFPLGTVLGTFMCAYLISAHGWQSIFLAGGVMPLLVAMAILIWLPESLQFLLDTNRDPAAVRRIVGRFVPPPAADARIIVDRVATAVAPIATLFSRNRASETLLLWFAFAAVFGCTVAVFSWAPAIMHYHGIPLSRAAIGVGIGGIGSLLGSACAGFLMERFSPSILLATAFVLGALAAACIGHAAHSLATVTVDLMVTGFLIPGFGGSALLALAANIYPTAMRSTGVGGAMGFGRFGQVVAPLVVSGVIATGFDVDDIYLLIALVMLVAAAAVFSLGRLGSITRVRAVA